MGSPLRSRPEKEKTERMETWSCWRLTRKLSSLEGSKLFHKALASLPILLRKEERKGKHVIIGSFAGGKERIYVLDGHEANTGQNCHYHPELPETPVRQESKASNICMTGKHGINSCVGTSSFPAVTAGLASTTVLVKGFGTCGCFMFPSGDD